jgi:cytoskeleton protein RodZ
MTSVGDTLRRNRESQGLVLAEIAQELCITKRYLQAIEDDDLKSLPGSFFYKSFVKQYAEILGIDAKSIQAGVDALTAEPVVLPVKEAETWVNNLSEPAFASPLRQVDPIVADTNRRYFSDRRLGYSVAGLVAVVLGCSGIYALWNTAVQVKPAARSVAPQPAASQTAVATQTASLQQTSTDAAGATPVTQSAQNLQPTVDVTTASDGLNHVVLNLSATEKTWLSITSAGKQVFSGVLEPSQTKTVTGLDAAQMKVGNAGGLEVRWNGKPIGPIGRRGEVRTVVFTPENFQILATPSDPLF